MTWMRVKRWIGGHPVAAGNIAVGACLAWGLLVPLVAAVLTEVGTLSGNSFELAVIGGCLLLPILLIVSSMVLGSVLGRAGLSVAGLLGAVKYVPLMVFAAVFAANVGVQLWEQVRNSFDPYIGTFQLRLSFDWPAILMSAALLSLLVMFLQGLGWALAAVLIRHKLRRGKWEIIRPATVEVRRPQWLEKQIVERPAAAVALLTALCLLLSLLIEIGLLIHNLETTGRAWRPLWQLLRWSVSSPPTMVGLSVQFGLTLVVFICAAGCVRGRQGLGLAPLVRGLAWGPPPAAAATLLLGVVGTLAVGQNLWTAVQMGGYWLFLLKVALAAACLTAAGQTLGLGLAWLITAIKRRDGTWPAPPAGPEDSP